ncbi:hypothetical protein A2U01_0074797, partial [Trifolium medium]|nr:hypothetical protein [Trifolium medium]
KSSLKMPDIIGGMILTYTEKEMTDSCEGASVRMKQEVYYGIATAQTMEATTVVTELHTKYYSVVSGGQHYSRIVTNLHATVIDASAQ